MQTRVAALAALETVIKNAVTAGSAAFWRDPEKDIDASHTGVVLMHDGDPGQPEVILSPLSYSWEHPVEFEVTASGKSRRAVVEVIIALFEPALAADRTLGGKVDGARIAQAPQFSEYEAEGSETERSGVLYVQLVYTTASGAG